MMNYKKRLPANTVFSSRVPFFSPKEKMATKFKNDNKINFTVVIRNKWGNVKVNGKLYAIHQKIIDILLSSEYIQVIDERDQSVTVLAPIYGILRRLKYQRPSKSNQVWLEERLKELCSVNIHIYGKTNYKVNGIIEKFGHSTKKISTIINGQAKYMYKFKFTCDYCNFVRQDIPMYFSNEEIDIFIGCHSFITLVIKNMLSHKPGAKYNIKKLVGYLLPNDSPRTKNRYLNLIIEWLDKLEQFGVYYDGKNLYTVKEN